VSGLLSPDRTRRWWMLALALVLTVGVALAYYLRSRGSASGQELLEFFTVWLAVPLGVGLLLLFAYLRPPKR
jgi:hypothetical protein